MATPGKSQTTTTVVYGPQSCYAPNNEKNRGKQVFKQDIGDVDGNGIRDLIVTEIDYSKRFKAVVPNCLKWNLPQFWTERYFLFRFKDEKGEIVTRRAEELKQVVIDGTTFNIGDEATEEAAPGYGDPRGPFIIKRFTDSFFFGDEIPLLEARVLQFAEMCTQKKFPKNFDQRRCQPVGEIPPPLLPPILVTMLRK